MIEIIQFPNDGDESDFQEFRDRIFSAAEASIDKYTVPLVVDANGTAADYRTGVLLQIADMRFLVTAAHGLLDHHQAGHALCIAQPVKHSHPVVLMEEEFFSTKDDDEDISVTQLTSAVADFIGQHWKFARLTDLMSRYDKLQGDGAYLIYGYPFALIEQDEKGGKVVDSWKYLTTLYQGDYANVENYRPDLHIVLSYERNTYSKAGEQIHPPGMSGCGIWYVGNRISHALFNGDDFKLVGIQNCWHRQHQYAKGTWIDDVLAIIWKYFPNARGAMRVHGMDFG